MVSIDNGATWFNTSGNDPVVNNDGTETNLVSFSIHDTNSTAGRSGELLMFGAGVVTLQKIGLTPVRLLHTRKFVASNQPINAIRVIPTATIGTGNLTSGELRLLAR